MIVVKYVTVNSANSQKCYSLHEAFQVDLWWLSNPRGTQ